MNQSQRNAAYWKANIGYVLNLLGVWFLVSYGGAIVFVHALNNFNLPLTQVPFGFWLAQQGAIYVYLILIAVYVKVMNKLDREFGVDE